MPCVGEKWVSGGRARGQFGACSLLFALPPWQDDQPRAFPSPSSSRAAEPPAGMRKKEATVLLAANFTANNR